MAWNRPLDTTEAPPPTPPKKQVEEHCSLGSDDRCSPPRRSPRDHPLLRPHRECFLLKVRMPFLERRWEGCKRPSLAPGASEAPMRWHPRLGAHDCPRLSSIRGPEDAGKKKQPWTTGRGAVSLGSRAQDRGAVPSSRGAEASPSANPFVFRWVGSELFLFNWCQTFGFCL